MKRLIFVSLLLFSIVTMAQSKFETAFLNKLYLGYGIDPAMLFNGPGHDYKDWGIESSYHWHAELGWEDDFNDHNGIRFAVTVADHDAIKYRKWAFRTDYKLRHSLFWIMAVNGLNQYAGIEFSSINRYDIPYRVNTETGVGPTGIQFTNDPTSYSVGVNFETQYEFPLYDNDYDGLRIAIGARYTFFLAENELSRDGKYIRDEGTVFLIGKF